MTGKYQQYPEYTESRSSWLQEIPVHWSTHALKHALRIRITDGPHETPEFLDEGIPFVSAEAVAKGFINFNKIRGHISEADDNRFSRKYRPQRHDVYMVKSGATTGVTAIVETDKRFNIWSPLAVMRCNDCFEPYFLLNYLRSSSFQESVQLSWSFGTQQNIGMGTLENLTICRPPLNEQRTIAAFLDYETARIDALIAKQQRLIELLKEKRQAVISHAVTKGLDPNVPMKKSGVEWLGQVPEHWQVSKLKWLATTTSGGTPTTSMQEEYYQDGQYPWVRTTDLNNSELYEVPVKITKQALTDTACSVLPIGTVLIAMYGGAGSIGKHSLLRFESTINQAVCGVIPCQELDPEFLHLYVEFYRPYWMAGAEGTRKDPNIGQDHIRDLVIPVPPLPEQYQLVSKVKGHFQQFEALDTKAQKAIALMHERRTALISAAVTGKIDVRNWQPKPSTQATELDLPMAAEQSAEYQV